VFAAYPVFARSRENSTGTPNSRGRHGPGMGRKQWLALAMVALMLFSSVAYTVSMI
jgi:hypothetical protein